MDVGVRIVQWKRIRTSYCRRYDKLIRYVGELCYCLRKYHYTLVSVFLEQHLSLNSLDSPLVLVFIDVHREESIDQD